MTGRGTRRQRVVIVGSGSAGRRHAAAAAELLPDAAVTVVRRADSRQPTPGASIDRLVTTLDAAVDEPVALGIVAGPAPFHAAATTALLDAGATVLVEKPLAATIEDAVKIRQHRHAADRVLVGYHLRFADTVPALARLVSDGALGRPTGFSLSVGQHLAQWRPAIDPRESVTARHELGGGVLLELSHELDGARFVLGHALGETTAVAATTSRDGAPTDGIVETVADIDVTTGSGVAGRIHLDMTSTEAHRVWSVVGSEATAIADLMAGSISVTKVGDATPEVVWQSQPGERDRAERRLIAHLIDIGAGAAAPECTVDDGLAALRIVEASHRSAADHGSLVAVEPS